MWKFEFIEHQDLDHVRSVQHRYWLTFVLPEGEFTELIAAIDEDMALLGLKQELDQWIMHEKRDLTDNDCLSIRMTCVDKLENGNREPLKVTTGMLPAAQVTGDTLLAKVFELFEMGYQMLDDAIEIEIFKTFV